MRDFGGTQDGIDYAESRLLRELAGLFDARGKWLTSGWLRRDWGGDRLGAGDERCEDRHSGRSREKAEGLAQELKKAGFDAFGLAEMSNPLLRQGMRLILSLNVTDRSTSSSIVLVSSGSSRSWKSPKRHLMRFIE